MVGGSVGSIAAGLGRHARRAAQHAVDLYLHQQGLDTITPSGKAMFGMLGVFAEFEWAMIQERVKAGMARARAEGKQVGRPKIAVEVEQSIREALQAGRGIISTAKGHRAGVSAVKAQLATGYSKIELVSAASPRSALPPIAITGRHLGRSEWCQKADLARRFRAAMFVCTGQSQINPIMPGSWPMSFKMPSGAFTRGIGHVYAPSPANCPQTDFNGRRVHRCTGVITVASSSGRPFAAFAGHYC
jgi:hypothetical protein